jgi:hypothetical protein
MEGLDEEAKSALESLPAHCQRGLEAFILDGRIPGDFLSAVLRNDLKSAFWHADDTNEKRLREYVVFLYNHAPSACWGSAEAIGRWASNGGLNGLRRAERAAEVKLAPGVDARGGTSDA